MTSRTQNRIASIDLLKGLVMVLMALDHTRDYFHSSAFLYDPSNPELTSLPIFFTRWITNFCAPTFSFLAGLSAFFIGRHKDTRELSAFLVKRGLWLVFLELTVVNFAWYFDPQFRTPDIAVIWSLGISMLVLSVLVYLPRKVILLLSCVLFFGHNLLDPIHIEGNMLWAILHEASVFKLSDLHKFYINYPVIPWVAVMPLGYCFGDFYNPSFDQTKRKKILTTLGISFIGLFVILRSINVYGDPVYWREYDTNTKTILSFLATTKYPPSLSYLLMTLGPAFLFLANSEKLKGRLIDFFSTFGRVPFFYYLVHLYLIHGLAVLAAQLTGFGWKTMILADWVTEIPQLKGYGFRLWVVYLIWALVIGLLYPLCRKFDRYKQTHKEKGWLSYL